MSTRFSGLPETTLSTRPGVRSKPNSTPRWSETETSLREGQETTKYTAQASMRFSSAEQATTSFGGAEELTPLTEELETMISVAMEGAT